MRSSFCSNHIVCITSPAALTTIVGVLTEVPIMLILVKIANSTKHWFSKPKAGTPKAVDTIE